MYAAASARSNVHKHDNIEHITVNEYMTDFGGFFLAIEESIWF